MKINNTHYRITSKNGNSFRIAVLADIHYYHKKDIKKLNKVFDEIKNIQPNFICIPGDIVDQRYIKDSEYLINWLIKLSLISKVLISLGNHELINGGDDYAYDKELFQRINNINNVYFLDNKKVSFSGVNFIGLTIPGDYYYTHKEQNANYLIDYINSQKKLISKGYNILLCHTPIELSKRKIFNRLDISDKLDLVICGHTHGGITPNCLKKYLKGIGLISPHNKVLVKKSYGHFKVNNTHFIISSGITKSSHLNHFSYLDFLFSKEITIIDIKNLTN